MTGTLSERTLLPEHLEELAELRRFLEHAPEEAEPAVLRNAVGDKVAVPTEVYAALRLVTSALSEGKAVTVAPLHTSLTTQEAAELLGMSRPTLVKILDQGSIPFTRPGRHRRVQLDDILAYQERRRAARAAGLAELVRVSEDLGLYDDQPFEPLRR